MKEDIWYNHDWLRITIRMICPYGSDQKTMDVDGWDLKDIRKDKYDLVLEYTRIIPAESDDLVTKVSKKFCTELQGILSERFGTAMWDMISVCAADPGDVGRE